MTTKIFHKYCIVITSLLTLLNISCSTRDTTTFIPSDSDEESTIQFSKKKGDVLSYLDSHQNLDLSPSTSVFSKSNNSSNLSKKYEEEDLETRYKASEVINLFNGKDLTGWVNESGASPQGWAVQDGLLRLVDPHGGRDLLTKESFSNYILTFEWRFGKECNSGIKYKIEQPNQRGWIGLEYQIQDDLNVDDGRIANRKIASLFDMLAAKESSQNSKYPAPITNEPSGDFRQGKIVVFENQVEHWLDGEKVLAFSIGTNEWEAAKKQSKYKTQKNFGLVSSSPILLQAHGYPIDFKSVTIQILSDK